MLEEVFTGVRSEVITAINMSKMVLWFVTTREPTSRCQLTTQRMNFDNLIAARTSNLKKF
jgi:hypothetical protein